MGFVSGALVRRGPATGGASIEVEQTVVDGLKRISRTALWPPGLSDYFGTDAVTGLEGLLSVPVLPTLVT